MLNPNRISTLFAAVAIMWFAATGWSQTAVNPPTEDLPAAAAHETGPTQNPGIHQAAPLETSPASTPIPAKPTYTVPAGTKVLLSLRSAINTKSARPGDGVYLASTFPVVVGTRVMIPAGVYVQGVVDSVVRAGRVKGRAQLNLHFTSIIFPNGTVVEIPGIINSLPGSSKRTVDKEGKVE